MSREWKSPMEEVEEDAASKKLAFALQHALAALRLIGNAGHDRADEIEDEAGWRR